MKLVVITPPIPVAGEDRIIQALIAQGVFRVHIRHPESSIEIVRSILAAIPEECIEKVVLHDHHQLVNEFAIGGLHLNHRHPSPPPDYSGPFSRSCHSFSELKEHKKECEYLFLSPIFDSISKQGLRSAFPPPVLTRANLDGIIDEKVFALGGITLQHIPALREWGFGGAAVLGDFWELVKHNEWQSYLMEWKKYAIP